MCVPTTTEGHMCPHVLVGVTVALKTIESMVVHLKLTKPVLG